MARFDRVIPPGQEGHIVASVDTHKYSGPVTKSVRVTTNDPAKPDTALSLRADIQMWMDVLPNWNINLTGDQGTAVKKELRLKSREPGAAPEIASVTSSNPWVTARVEKIPPDSAEAAEADLRLLLTLSPEAPVGLVGGTVTLTGAGPKPRVLELALAGKVYGPIAVFPQAVNLFAQPSSGRSDRLTGMITLQARPERPGFEIEKIEADDERLKIEEIPDEENRRHRISVRWTTNQTKGDFTGTIIVHTNSPDMPEVEIPYRVRIL